MTKFIPQQKNANKHTLHGTRLLEKSITSDGWIGAMTSAADKEIFDGSDRIGVMEDKFVNEKGETVEPIIVESDGTRPVIVIRKDIPSADDPKAKRLSIAANQVPHTNYDMDGDLLKEWGNEDAAIKAMFAESEWDGITYEATHPKTLEELAAEYGGSLDDDFHSIIRIKVTPEIKSRFDAVMVLMPGANEMEKIDALISRGEQSFESS